MKDPLLAQFNSNLHKTEELRLRFRRGELFQTPGRATAVSVSPTTHLVSVDGSEVFIHLINGIPLCRQKEGEGEEEVFPG